MKHQLRVTQVLRVEREIVVERDADDLDEAIDAQYQDDYPDGEWKTTETSVESTTVRSA